MSLKPITIKTIVRDKKGVKHKECLRADNLKTEPCKPTADPYHIFLIDVEIIPGRLILISPVAGRCVGVGKDGKTIFSMGCTTPDDVLMYEDSKLVNEKNQCLSSGLNCGRYIIESTNNERIWWNTPEILQLYSRMIKGGPARHKLSSKLGITPNFALEDKDRHGRLLQKIDIDDDSEDWKWKLEITDLGKESISNKLKANSVPDGPVVWLGYRSAQPQILYFIGPVGTEKSSIIDQAIRQYRLVNPIVLSTDNVIPLISSNKGLKRLGLFSNIRRVTGIPNLRATDRQISEEICRNSYPFVEKLKKFAVENKIDIVAESTDYPSLDDIQDMTAEGYKVSVLLVTVDEEIRKERQMRRFELTGRYGGGSKFTEDKNEKFRALMEQNNVKFRLIAL